uniref:Uncharacterized protein n=1 Tax=Peromyscus maniculatus bairdii TaxID=230844 RepID=A0A8C8W7L6_PERMB
MMTVPSTLWATATRSVYIPVRPRMVICSLGLKLFLKMTPRTPSWAPLQRPVVKNCSGPSVLQRGHWWLIHFHSCPEAQNCVSDQWVKLDARQPKKGQLSRELPEKDTAVSLEAFQTQIFDDDREDSILPGSWTCLRVSMKPLLHLYQPEFLTHEPLGDTDLLPVARGFPDWVAPVPAYPSHLGDELDGDGARLSLPDFRTG